MKKNKKIKDNITSSKKSLENATNITKNTTKNALNSLKELPNLQWSQLPTKGWIFLILGFLGLTLIFILLVLK